MKTIEKDGFIFEVNDDGSASVRLCNEYNSEEVIVPSEFNGTPVRSFNFSCRGIDQDNIKYIMLPESVNMFKFDHSFKHSINIEIDERNPHFFTDGKTVYTKDLSELVSFLAIDDEEYTIQDGCKKILKQAFSNAKNLRRVIFPKGLNIIGKSAFKLCRKLAELELPDGLREIGMFAFCDCTALEKLVLPSTLEVVGTGAFQGCDRALTVALPKMLRRIDYEAFPCNWTLVLNEKNKSFISTGDLILSGDGLKIMRIARPIENGVLAVPNNVTQIASWAFDENDRIEKVILPKTLHTIEERAFIAVRSLREINLENVKEIGNYAFERCESLEKISLKCDNISTGTFIGCKNLTEAELDCKIIGESAFLNCERLRKVILKNTKVLGESSFNSTTKLKEIVLPYGLENIGDNAFSRSGIKALTIPKTVRHIGKNIADYVREIHIYDNIETDVKPSNDISYRDYILYVHSAETDEIKYAVPIVGDFGHATDHTILLTMFNGGVNFDFRQFDSYFGRISDEYALEKFNAGRLRLKYGYKLDEKTRIKYERQLIRLAPLTVEFCIDKNKIEDLFDPELYECLSIEQMLTLIELSARKNQTELTAFLMQICNEKRKGD